MSRLVSLAGLVLLLAPALAWAQVESLATFGTPRRVSSSTRDTYQTRVGVDGNGNAVFMWLRFDGVNNRAEARALSATGTLGPVRTLSEAGQPSWMHDLAVNAAGFAIFAWVRSDGTNMRVQVATRSAAGVFSAVQTVSPAGVDAHWPAVALDGNGRALIVWQGSDGVYFRIRARTRAVNGTLGAMDTISAGGESSWMPRVAMQPTGRAILTWYRHDGANYRVQTRVRESAGTWSAVQVISPDGVNGQNPEVAFTPTGATILVWQSGGANVLVQTRRRSAAGQLGPVDTLSATGQNALGARLAVDGSGNVAFVWYRSDGTYQRVQARFRSGATLSPIFTLSLTGADSSNPDVAVDANGNAVFVWERFDGTTAIVQTRTRAAGGVFSPIRDLASSVEEGMRPVVAVDPDGNVVFGWAAKPSTVWQVFTAPATLP